MAASFQKAVVDVLVEHAMHAMEEYGFKKFAIAGGVASNSALRSRYGRSLQKARGGLLSSLHPFSVRNNAAMIGAALTIIPGRHQKRWDLNAVPNLKLGER